MAVQGGRSRWLAISRVRAAGESRLRLSSRAVSLRVLSPESRSASRAAPPSSASPSSRPARCSSSACAPSRTTPTPSRCWSPTTPAPTRASGVRAARRRRRRRTVAGLRPPARQRGLRPQHERRVRGRAPADVVIINSDVVVPAAGSRGCATRRTRRERRDRHGVHEPRDDRVGPRAQPPSPEPPARAARWQSARGDRAASLRLRPRIPTCIGHCLLRAPRGARPRRRLRRRSPRLRRGGRLLAALRQRGLVHVVADDVFV